MAISSVNNAPGAALTIQDEFFSNVKSGNQQNVERLIANGADLNFLSEEGTALHLAVEKANRAMVEFLLNNGADPNISKKIETIETEEVWDDGLDGWHVDKVSYQAGGETPLWEAVTKKYDGIAELLLSFNASPTILPVNDDPTYGLWGELSSVSLAGIAIGRGAVLLTELILNYQSIDDLGIHAANELLSDAISSGDDNGIMFILETFPKFHVPNNLQDLLKEEKVEIAKKIFVKCEGNNSDEKLLIALALGKNTEAEQSLGDTQNITDICRSGISIFELIDLFVEEEEELPDSFYEKLKEKINTPFGEDQSTFLLIAVNGNDYYLIEEILYYGANPDHVDNNGMAALDYAAKVLNHEVAQMLIDCDADLDKAIEFAENEAEPSREVITFLKDLFGRRTKGCLS